ncbi:hypothetical protein FACS189450_10240 [Spirochaetia bacterium]|nr:hypothetical protein FACS189450_10240 [Spirochaetia bacterium]
MRMADEVQRILAKTQKLLKETEELAKTGDKKNTPTCEIKNGKMLPNPKAVEFLTEKPGHTIFTFHWFEAEKMIFAFYIKNDEHPEPWLKIRPPLIQLDEDHHIYLFVYVAVPGLIDKPVLIEAGRIILPHEFALNLLSEKSDRNPKHYPSISEWIAEYRGDESHRENPYSLMDELHIAADRLNNFIDRKTIPEMRQWFKICHDVEHIQRLIIELNDKKNARLAFTGNVERWHKKRSSDECNRERLEAASNLESCNCDFAGACGIMFEDDTP